MTTDIDVVAKALAELNPQQAPENPPFAERSETAQNLWRDLATEAIRVITE